MYTQISSGVGINLQDLSSEVFIEESPEETPEETPEDPAEELIGISLGIIIGIAFGVCVIVALVSYYIYSKRKKIISNDKN